MARHTRAAFERMLRENHEAQIARAFQAAIQDVRSATQRRAIDEAMRRAVATGDLARGVAEIMQALQLGSEFFAPLDRQIEEAFLAGALYERNLLPKLPTNTVPRLVVRFDLRRPRAEAIPRRIAGRLITELTADQRILVQEHLTEGIAENRPWRTMARELIGTLQGNERKGGLIGLHSRDARAVARRRRQLESEGRKADQIARMTRAYSDRLLRRRGQTIARTEGAKAANAGRIEQMQQMIDDGKIPADIVTKVWQATPSVRTREHHTALNGTEVPWNGVFISPATGFPMVGPHAEGAPGVDTVNCRCGLNIKVDYSRLAQ